MSDVSVDIIKNRSGEAPDLPSGANLSGVSTAATLQVTNLNPTHINASGVTTATTFSGSMKSTSTPTLGLGVTINSSGLNISGVATAGIVSATTLYGDGSNLTGVAMSIAPVSYTPDVNDTVVPKSGSGIGITFTQRVIAGSGNVTLRIAGAAGTVVENFGVGNSVTIANNTVSFTPTADLAKDTVYHINYPSGSITNTGGDVSYVGTSYTFTSQGTVYEMWLWGTGANGRLGQNNVTTISSPVQLAGNWSLKNGSYKGADGNTLAVKEDGTLWAMGYGGNGTLGQNNTTQYSSPVQIPGTTWDDVTVGYRYAIATKTDNTLWSWGYGDRGTLAQNNRTTYSSPIQIPGTTWNRAFANASTVAAFKTDGTMWMWGFGNTGQLGNNKSHPSSASEMQSSPIQVGSETTWNVAAVSQAGGDNVSGAIKTDGTLWVWGWNQNGDLGVNDLVWRSSPTQIPGTNWAQLSMSSGNSMATKTDGTLWTWGNNNTGALGQNSRTQYSSPVQVPGSTWSTTEGAIQQGRGALKTDGTMWVWGYNSHYGVLGTNQGPGQLAALSSPVQIPGTDWSRIRSGAYMTMAIKEA